MTTDKEHLQWMLNRLAEVHGENRNVDYMTRMQKIIDSTKTELNLHIVMPSFTDDERTQFVEETIMYNKQNLNGRETEDEIYEAGVCAGFDDLLEKLNEA